MTLIFFNSKKNPRIIADVDQTPKNYNKIVHNINTQNVESTPPPTMSGFSQPHPYYRLLAMPAPFLLHIRSVHAPHTPRKNLGKILKKSQNIFPKKKKRKLIPKVEKFPHKNGLAPRAPPLQPKTESLHRS